MRSGERSPATTRYVLNEKPASRPAECQVSNGRGSMNLSRLDLISIRLVVLCEQHGTLSAAARQANLSLSGASHRLKQFENAMGQQLFRRLGRGLVPTSAGTLAAHHGREVLLGVSRLCSALTAKDQAVHDQPPRSPGSEPKLPMTSHGCAAGCSSQGSHTPVAKA